MSEQRALFIRQGGEIRFEMVYRSPMGPQRHVRSEEYPKIPLLQAEPRWQEITNPTRVLRDYVLVGEAGPYLVYAEED